MGDPNEEPKKSGVAVEDVEMWVIDKGIGHVARRVTMEGNGSLAVRFGLEAEQPEQYGSTCVTARSLCNEVFTQVPYRISKPTRICRKCRALLKSARPRPGHKFKKHLQEGAFDAGS